MKASKTSVKSTNNPTPHRASRSGSGNKEFTSQIAEAAYYKAEARGFAPGYELEDWLKAEQEVRQ